MRFGIDGCGLYYVDGGESKLLRCLATKPENYIKIISNFRVSLRLVKCVPQLSIISSQ